MPSGPPGVKASAILAMRKSTWDNALGCRAVENRALLDHGIRRAAASMFRGEDALRCSRELLRFSR